QLCLTHRPGTNLELEPFTTKQFVGAWVDILQQKDFDFVLRKRCFRKRVCGEIGHGGVLVSFSCLCQWVTESNRANRGPFGVTKMPLPATPRADSSRGVPP